MRDYIAEANRFMYDDNYITEQKIKIDGKEYPSIDQARAHLKSVGLKPNDINRKIANAKNSKIVNVNKPKQSFKSVKNVTDILGARGEVGEDDVIAFLKKHKIDDDLMSSVIGYYGIDGEEYFDENGNWKTKKKAPSPDKEKKKDTNTNESPIEKIVNKQAVENIKTDMGKVVSLFKKNGLSADDAASAVLFNIGFGLIDDDLKKKYLKFGKKDAFALDSKIRKVYQHLVDDNNLEHKDVKEYLTNIIKKAAK